MRPAYLNLCRIPLSFRFLFANVPLSISVINMRINCFIAEIMFHVVECDTSYTIFLNIILVADSLC